MYIPYIYIYIYIAHIFELFDRFFSTSRRDFTMVMIVSTEKSQHDFNMTELFRLVNYQKFIQRYLENLSMSCIWVMDDCCEQIVRR